VVTIDPEKIGEVGLIFSEETLAKFCECSDYQNAEIDDEKFHLTASMIRPGMIATMGPKSR